MIRVVHLTSTHYWNDARVFYKECATLTRAGHEVYYLAVGTPKRFERQGVQITQVLPASSRLGRLFGSSIKLYRLAKQLNADVYHFHDPDLVLAGLWLHRRARVIYDVHEDFPKQVLIKGWLPLQIRRAASGSIARLERWASARLDAIIAATPLIAQRFPSEKTLVIQNFPSLTEIGHAPSIPFDQRRYVAIYTGGIALARGAREMVVAIERVSSVLEPRLFLAGYFESAALEQELRCLSGWARVHFHGWLDRTELFPLFAQSRVGLVVLHPTPNYIESQPIKLFEYMGMGLPVIASDFPLWREFVGDPPCGIMVNPTDIDAIARALEWLFTHPRQAEQMGRLGQQYVKTRYNWEHEARKLLRLYEQLTSENP